MTHDSICCRVRNPALLGAVAIALWTGAGQADDTGLSEQERQEGFTLLLRPGSFEGWQEVQGAPGSFKWEGNVLCGERQRATRTAYWLSTQKKYRNFILRLEYMLPKDGNSGVFIRVPHHQGRTSREGMEIQLMDDGAKSGKPTPSATGAVYQVVAANAYVARPANHWNELEIRCDEDEICVTLNGKRINQCRMSEHEKLKQRPREGYIGLSAHSHRVRFRNVRLKVLPSRGDKAAAVPATANPESSAS